jgi:hypothetical protein
MRLMRQRRAGNRFPDDDRSGAAASSTRDSPPIELTCGLPSMK